MIDHHHHHLHHRRIFKNKHMPQTLPNKPGFGGLGIALWTLWFVGLCGYLGNHWARNQQPQMSASTACKRRTRGSFPNHVALRVSSMEASFETNIGSPNSNDGAEKDSDHDHDDDSLDDDDLHDENHDHNEDLDDDHHDKPLTMATTHKP